MSDSEPNKTSKPKHELISSLCPKMEQVPDFSDGSKQQRCMGCDTPIFNLSALTEQEAHKLIDEGEEICIRYETNDADEPVFRPNNKSTTRYSALAGGLSLALGMTAACGTPADNGHSTQQASTTKPIPKEQQSSSTVKGAKVGTTSPHRVGKVAREWPKEVQQQIDETRDKYNAGKMTREEYSAALSEIKTKARQKMYKRQPSN